MHELDVIERLPGIGPSRTGCRESVRIALEQAHLYLAVIDFVSGGKEIKWGDFQAAIGPARKKAGKANFPDLLEAVNERLSQPLHFEKEFLSFQKVRNCLEHRAGIVAPIDADASGHLVLSLPRLILFYMKDGKEIEVRHGERIEGEAGQGVAVFMRMGTERFEATRAQELVWPRYKR